MSSSYRHSLSLRARHDAADLSIIPQTLDMSAKYIWKAGEARNTPKGTPLEGEYKNSYCLIELPSQADLPTSLASALDKFSKHRDFFRAQNDAGVRFGFFVGWFSERRNSGDTLDARLLQGIADLKISLELDFYAPEEAQA